MANWGSVPDWVGAVGSAGALIGAVVLLGIESSRRRSERRAEEEDQASLVAVWLDGADFESGTWIARVSNRSDLPIFDCFVDVWYPNELPSRAHIWGVRPQDALDSNLVAARSDPTSRSVFPNVSLQFVDANGRGWRRDEFSRLHRQPDVSRDPQWTIVGGI